MTFVKNSNWIKVTATSSLDTNTCVSLNGMSEAFTKDRAIKFRTDEPAGGSIRYIMYIILINGKIIMKLLLINVAKFLDLCLGQRVPSDYF